MGFCQHATCGCEVGRITICVTHRINILNPSEVRYNPRSHEISLSTTTIFRWKFMSSWWNVRYWLDMKLSFWQLPVKLVMTKISSKWHFSFSVSSWKSTKRSTVPLWYCMENIGMIHLMYCMLWTLHFRQFQTYLLIYLNVLFQHHFEMQLKSVCTGLRDPFIQHSQNFLTVDSLVTQGARTSTAIVLT